jgi:hypothetical protein
MSNLECSISNLTYSFSYTNSISELCEAFMRWKRSRRLTGCPEFF